jgi:Gram-negative porin
MMKFRVTVAAAAVMMSGVVPVYADGLGDYFSYSGFGTLGAVRSSTDEAQFGYNRQLGGATEGVDFETDSDLGLQLTGKANDWLSATVQGLAEKINADQISMAVEWAFLKLQPIDGLTIRAGRMAMPTFIVSDSINVGYATTWLRAPNEVYGLAMLPLLEGGDITYRKSLGPVAVSVTALGGESTLRALGTNYEARDVRGANLQVETDWVTFRAGKVETSEVEVGGTPQIYSFTGFGASVDHNNIVAQAEFVERRAGYYYNIVSANGWYVMGGYRFGKFTPYAIYSSTDPQYNPDSAPVQLAVPLISNIQKTVATGVRWDAFSSVDFKFQLERVNTDGTPGISFSNPDLPGALRFDVPITHPVTVVSANVDFVF